MNELNTLSAKQLATLIKNKKISCVEIMQAHLNRIAKVNPLLNAIVQQLPAEQALAQARAADAAVASGKLPGKLHGVPITIKQGRKVKNFSCDLGVKSPLNSIATEDATVVARLRAEGAIILGVTNIPDFEMSYETDNALYGRTNNPYDLNRSPGGSSGGEAAIITAGGSSLGIGADAGGSIRQPAHNCGIAGIKPTMNLIPYTGKFPYDGFGILSLVATQGPMARYVEDLIYVLPILAGPDGRDPAIPPVTLYDPAQVDLKSLRIAFYTDNGVATPRADITNTVNNAVQELAKQVALIKEDCPPIKQEILTALEELFFYGGDRGQWLQERMQQMQVEHVAPPFQDLLDTAQQCEFSVTELHRRLLLLNQLRFSMMNFMQNYDVIICPVATAPASLYEKSLAAAEGFDLAQDLTYNLPYNITGWPAAVVRCGTSPEGLPIGVQIIAKPWQDHIALAVAKRLEEIFGGWQPSLL